MRRKLLDCHYNTVAVVFLVCLCVMVLKTNVVCAFSGSHVVIQLVEKYPEYYIVNLDKVNSHSALTYNTVMSVCIQECVCVCVKV